jgi:hypothetical protein
MRFFAGGFASLRWPGRCSFGSEKPPFTAGTGLQDRCQERKSQETNSPHHERQPKWEIPVQVAKYSGGIPPI